MKKKPALEHLFYNARYRMYLAFDRDEINGPLAEYRENLLHTVGIKPNSAAFMYALWKPGRKDPHEDSFMVEYARKKWGVAGKGKLETDVGLIFDNVTDPDDMLYITADKLIPMAHKGHAFNQDRFRMDKYAALKVGNWLCGDIMRETVKMNWNLCPHSGAHVKFLPKP